MRHQQTVVEERAVCPHHGEKLSFGGLRVDVNFKLFAVFNGSTGLWSMDVSVSSRSCVPEKGPGPVGLKKGSCCCV